MTQPSCASPELMNFYSFFRALLQIRLLLLSQSCTSIDRRAIEAVDVGATVDRYLSIAGHCLA